MPQLNWLGDAEAKRAARRVPYRMLEPVESVGDAASGNWLIQGDNLDALKALLPFYAGRVKCIFIDPPYNTKSAFEHYDDNLEHSQWLSMMYPRLELLRELLRDLLAEDGSIWVTIDAAMRLFRPLSSATASHDCRISTRSSSTPAPIRRAGSSRAVAIQQALLPSPGRTEARDRRRGNRLRDRDRRPSRGQALDPQSGAPGRNVLLAAPPPLFFLFLFA